MGLVWSDTSSQRRLAHTPARDRQRSAALPRRGVPLRATPRASFRWLRGFASLAQVRSRRDSFRGLLDTPSPLMPSEPRMSERDALKALARVNAAVRASQSIADPRCPQGDLRPT